jgi:ribonuclease R
VNDATVVAVIEKRGRFWAAEPHFPAPRSGGDGRRSGGGRRIVLASNRVYGSGGGTVSAGELALVQLGGGGGRRGDGRARVVRRIGRPDVARDAIEALMLDRGLARGFEPDVVDAAERACERGANAAAREVQEGRRRDLRGLATLTIDPATAQDYDDAISAERLDGDGVVRVWVHIADVSAYVREGSAVDREARRRGTSVYAPGAVEPMLPQALSNDACSLAPGVERATVTVEMDVRGAEIVRSAFYRSLIRSDIRLDYEQVDRVFAAAERAQDPWAAPLALAREASAALGGARERAGGLVIDSEEPEVMFDEDGNVREMRMRAQTESHRLIEHLMIAANEAVARHLSERGVSCLYRVHERPEPARVLRLVEQLASLGVSTPAVSDTISPSQAAELMGEISRSVERHVQRALKRAESGRAGKLSPDGAKAASERARVGPWGGRIALSSLVLRSLRQAYYSPRNIGHAGLHSACYCHFTSPIRRYPDLVCHRALISTLGGEEAPPRAGELGELGEWASEREREAMQIERDGDDLARCFALEQALYEHGWEQVFTGEVTGVISAGAFVVFGGAGARREDAAGTPPGPLYEGMLPVRRMRTEEGRDWWELNEHETILRGERSGATIRLGDPIAVRVARVDTVRGRVDLAPDG